MAVSVFSLARFHFGDAAAEHRDTTQKLHVEMPHFERADSRFADQRERLGQKVQQWLLAFGAVFERQTPFAELMVVELFQLRFDRIDPLHEAHPPRQFQAGHAADRFHAIGNIAIARFWVGGCWRGFERSARGGFEHLRGRRVRGKWPVTDSNIIRFGPPLGTRVVSRNRRRAIENHPAIRDNRRRMYAGPRAARDLGAPDRMG